MNMQMSPAGRRGDTSPKRCRRRTTRLGGTSLILTSYSGGRRAGRHNKPAARPRPLTHVGAGREARPPLAARGEAGGSAPVRGKEVEAADWLGGAAAPPHWPRGRGQAGPVSRPSRTAAAAADKGPPQGPPPSWLRALPPARSRRLLPLRPRRSPPRSPGPSCPPQLAPGAAAFLPAPRGVIPSAASLQCGHLGDEGGKWPKRQSFLQK